MIGNCLVAVLSCNVGYKLTKTGKLRKNTVRKVFHCTGTGFGSVSLFLLTIWGQNVTACIILFFLNISMFGCVYCGHVSSSLNIAPNFSNILVGLMMISTTLSELFSTLLITIFNSKRNTFESWCHLFGIMSGASFFSFMFYLIFGTDDVQPWNNKIETVEEHSTVLLLT